MYGVRRRRWSRPFIYDHLFIYQVVQQNELGGGFSKNRLRARFSRVKPLQNGLSGLNHRPIVNTINLLTHRPATPPARLATEEP